MEAFKQQKKHTSLNQMQKTPHVQVIFKKQQLLKNKLELGGE